MDVIALHQAGFANAVATLGTAFTERQMESDGTSPPNRSSVPTATGPARPPQPRHRPHVAQFARGHSFRFAFLPEGPDPDDLVRSQGAKAFAECLAAARPLIDVPWLRELKAHAIDTPECCAAFEAGLERLLAQIGTSPRARPLSPRSQEPAVALWREQGTRRGKSLLIPRHVRRAAARRRCLRPMASPSSLSSPSSTIPSCSIASAKKSAPSTSGTGARRPASYPDLHHLRGMRTWPTSNWWSLLEAEHLWQAVAQLSRDSAFKRVAFRGPDRPEAEVEHSSPTLPTASVRCPISAASFRKVPIAWPR